VTRAEAQQVLLLYRPGSEDSGDAAMAQALSLAQDDRELGQWFEQHCAFQRAMRAKFRQIEVPTHLKTSLLVRGQAQPMLVSAPPTAGRRPAWLAAAAALLVLLGLAGWWWKPHPTDPLANFRARMVGQVLRSYEANMSIVTNDMRLIRQDLATRGAPADYVVPKGLERLKLTGGGRLTWRNHPVAMVCFDRGDKQMLYLFVMDRSALRNPPPITPQLAKVKELLSASWTAGDKTYVLAGPEEEGFLKKYF
jgi:hypothetical protein